MNYIQLIANHSIDLLMTGFVVAMVFLIVAIITADATDKWFRNQEGIGLILFFIMLVELLMISLTFAIFFLIWG